MKWPGLKTGMGIDLLLSEIGSGLGEPGALSPRPLREFQ